MNRLFLKIVKEILQKEIDEHEMDAVSTKQEIWDDVLKYIKKVKNLEKKIDYCESLLSFAKEKKLQRVRGLFLWEIGNSLEKQNYSEKALSYLEEALKIMESEGNNQENKELLNQMSSLYQKQGEFIKALGYSERAKKLGSSPEKKAPEKQSTGKAAMLTRQISEVVHSWEKNLLELMKEWEYAHKEKNLEEERMLLFKIGKLYEQLKKDDEAIRCWKDSLLLSQKGNDIELCFQNALSLGKILIERKDFGQAKEALVDAISCLDHSKDYLGELSYLFVQEHIELFYLLIDCCLQQGNFLGSLHFLEHSIRWFYFSRIDEEILLKKANVPEEIKQEYCTALKKCQENFKAGLPIETEKKNAQDIRLQIELLDPEWANFWGHHYSIDIPGFQQNLPKGTVLLEFLATDKKCLVFLLDSSHLETLVFPDFTCHTLEELYEPFLQNKNISSFLAMKDHSHYMKKSLEKISDALGAKILEILENWEAERIVLIPCHAFQLFPLHLLPLCDQQKKDWVWQDRYEIVYAPSLTWVIKSINNKEQKPEGKAIFLQHSGKKYKFFHEEIQILQSLWAGRVISEEEKPTWENVKKSLSKVSYLHFGIYGNLSFPDSLLSRLYFAEESKNPGEGISHLQILSEDFSSVSMLSLSASELNIQEWNAFGDAMGIFMSFLYAGAKGVVANLWSVPDCISYFIMEKFHQGLVQGLPPSMALQESQKEIRQMTVLDLRRKLSSLRRLLPENEAKWIKELSDFLEYKNKDFPLEKRRQILKNLYKPRKLEWSGLVQSQEKDFSLLEDEENSVLKDLEDSQKKIFSDPFFWGSFVCMGLGFSKASKESSEDEENFDSVHIEEAACDEDGKNTVQEIKDILSLLSSSNLPASGANQEAKEKEPQKIRDKSQYRIKGRCSYCGKKIRCQLSSEGSRVRCPHCKKKIWIPIQSSPFDDVKIPATCPYCTKKIHCFLTMAGSRGKCPKCDGRIRIPKRDVLLSEIATGNAQNPILLLKEKSSHA
ncbi:MAG: CHAT domain-containing protein [Candidatus Brocadiae bacterium]|nr:CHAT domain-containing protein [Candidatus Brocadiia bacterium]